MALLFRFSTNYPSRTREQHSFSSLVPSLLMPEILNFKRIPWTCPSFDFHHDCIAYSPMLLYVSQLDTRCEGIVTLPEAYSTACKHKPS